MLGITNTQLIVTDVTPADATDTTGLPTVGSIYDAMNFGNGYENVYTALPGADGTVTDTVVTPYGNIDLDSLFGTINDANALNPAQTLSPVCRLATAPSAPTRSASAVPPSTEPSRAAPRASPPSSNSLVYTTAIGPWWRHADDLRHRVRLRLAQQNFNVYDGSASSDEIGSITTNDQVTNLLGFTNTEFTVAGATALGDTPHRGSAGTRIGLPDVLNLGGGIENVYTALPGATGEYG